MNNILKRKADLFHQILSTIIWVLTFTVLLAPYGSILQVRAESGDKVIPRANLALNKKATQSSTAFGGNASRAVDGVTDGNWNKNSVTHTNADYRPWWQVDLGAAYDISEIKIYNRTDCCQERLDKFWVVYSDSEIVNNGNAVNGTPVKSYASTGPWGASTQNPRVLRENAKKVRYIRIYLTGTNYLHLAEVEVFGTNVQNTPTTSTTSASIEQQCYNAIQGKVAYNRAGNKRWGASNVQKLCKGTTNTAATIACFQAEVQSHNSWSRGVEACRVGGTTPRATAPPTTTTSANIEQQCFNAIQGKVAYNRAGNKRWGASNVQKLCKGTSNTAATIACFQAEVQSHNSWSRGVEACRVGGTTPRANATAVKTATRSADTNRPSPLTPNQMSHVMQWISVKTSAARLPFCWRRSFGRGVGKIPLCPTGYVKEGLICFTPCKSDEMGVDGTCYRNCPAGFRNDGLYCGKPAAYGRGGGYIWKIGDKPFSLDGARARCSAANRQGCEKNGAIIYPKCKAGFYAAGSNVCSPICPSGYSDIGVSCKKPTSKRGVRYANRCPAGLVKDPTGDICYPACGTGNIAGVQEKYSGGGPKNNYKGVGPVCWQNCPSQQDVDCGAGCATSEGACAKAVFNMASAPIIAALKIAGLVVTAGATTGLTTSVAGGTLASKLPRLRPLFVMADKIQRFAKTYKTSITAGTASKTVILTLKSQTELFAKEFAANFGDMTSPEIEKMIDDKFSPAAALEIKKEWGRHHIGMMMEANTINTAKNFLSIAGIADPTGLVGVVDAFTNPLCKDDTPFPTINPKY